MNKPKVLLVGAGRFGRHYIRLFKAAEAAGRIDFAGVCVRSYSSVEAVANEWEVKAYLGLSEDLVAEVDVVCIVTPPETHHDLLKMCLGRVHVYVEKPLACTEAEIDELKILSKSSGYVCMVGHVLRFHPVTEYLQLLLKDRRPPRQISGNFVNPIGSDQGRDASLELLHLYDVVDSIWPSLQVVLRHRADAARLAKISLRYSEPVVGQFELGWEGERRERTLTFAYPEEKIVADFDAGTVTRFSGGQKAVISFTGGEELLQKEVNTFLSLIGGGAENPVPVATGAKIASIAQSAAKALVRRPRVAIIGAGVFGTNTALELASFCEVTIFEKHTDILQEGTKVNQFRHHVGYHYPRSDETVRDVQKSTALFDLFYEKALVRTIPTFYGIAKEGSHVKTKDFLNFCDRHNLPYELVTEHAFAVDAVESVVRVYEPSYHYESLYEITRKRLLETRVDVRTKVKVQRVIVDESGKKLVVLKSGDRDWMEEFDVVVNTTYAAINDMTRWLDVALVPIRVDLAEVLIVEIPIDPISLTVIDGPFATLMPTGNPHEFTLYHVVHSILDRYTPKDGLVKPVVGNPSKREAIFEGGRPFFPALEQATIKESRVVHRGVQAYREHDDSRVAELYDHGFGCYSMLSGKIVSSVSIARNLGRLLRKYYPH